MDGESSYESDISESWSLIDINVNEESFSTTEAPSEIKKIPLTELESEQSRNRTDVELEETPRKCKEVHKTDLDNSSGSDSDSSFGLARSSHREFYKIRSPGKTNLDEEGKNDSDDVESIEILDMDGNYRDSEIDRLDSGMALCDFHTYQPGDVLLEKITSKSRSNCSTVIKRNKLNKNSEAIVNSVNSEIEKCGAKACSNEAKEENGRSSEKSCSENSHPVYKHYRNNVTNTVLSLSLGVIFAGVACITVCHFMGVREAADTAVELVETLKKLQVENAALQSRLFYLNRALLNRETSLKRGVSLNELQGKVSCEKTPLIETSETQNTDLNCPALSEISSRLNPVEWLSRLQNLLQKPTGNAENLNGFGKYIRDQINFLRSRKEEGIEFLKGTDRKMSKVLQKLAARLFSPQGNIENIHPVDTINHIFNKILPDTLSDIRQGNPKFEKRAPVTEFDLQSFKWDSEEKIKENFPRKTTVLCQFPQPEKYYQLENLDINRVGEKQVGSTNASEFIKKDLFETNEKKYKKRFSFESDKKKHKKRGKSNWKRRDSKEKKFKDGNKEEILKRTVNKRAVKNFERGEKKKRKIFESGPVKYDFKSPFNETSSARKKSSKVNTEEVKHFSTKHKIKKIKKSHFKNSFLSNLKKNSFRKKKYHRWCLGHECFNVTGHWVFKWAGGREEFRRHQALGDWQFERAKGRKELRTEDYGADWQFKRALGRESNRHENRWHHAKHAKLNAKQFFTMGFHEFKTHKNGI